MTRLSLLIVLANVAVSSHNQTAYDPDQLPPISALVPECTVRMAPLGPRVPIGGSSGIWLTCSGVRFLVVRPENLLEKVRVQTSAQALEFVRFFTARTTFGPLEVGGCVEVSDDPKQSLLYRVEPRLFRRYLKAPVVEVRGSEAGGDLAFVTVRPVVCPDQSIYELSEQVDESGMYFQFDKRRILRRASTVGVSHAPAH